MVASFPRISPRAVVVPNCPVDWWRKPRRAPKGHPRWYACPGLGPPAPGRSPHPCAQSAVRTRQAHGTPALRFQLITVTPCGDEPRGFWLRVIAALKRRPLAKTRRAFESPVALPTVIPPPTEGRECGHHCRRYSDLQHCSISAVCPSRTSSVGLHTIGKCSRTLETSCKRPRRR